MTTKKNVICFLVLFLFGLTNVGCDRLAPSKLATHTEQPDIRGKIADVLVTGGKVNAIFIEGDLEGNTKYDKAFASIKDDTRFFKLVGDSYEVSSADELVEGQIVEVLFTGIIREKYPPSADAEEILIIQ